LGARAHLPGRVATDVDAGVPGAACESAQTGRALIAVAAQTFDFCGQFVGREAAIQNAYLMTGSEQGLGNVPADESRATEDEDVHGCASQGCASMRSRGCVGKTR